MKCTATWYCSMKGGKRGCVDNKLRPGDVALTGYHPKKRKVVDKEKNILSA